MKKQCSRLIVVVSWWYDVCWVFALILFQLISAKLADQVHLSVRP